jgi:opacity protein-like surface antigen
MKNAYVKKSVGILSVGAILCIAATGACADTTEGPYVGLGVGMYQTDVTLSGVGGSISAGDTSHDFGADVFAGYKWNMGVGGIAIEVGYTDSYGKVTDWTPAGNTLSAKITESKEIAVLPSYNLGKDTAAYIRLGYASAKGTETLNAASFSKTFTGFVWGLGVDHSVAKNVALRAEYKVLDLSSDTTGTVSFKPRAAGLNIGLRYAF